MVNVINIPDTIFDNPAFNDLNPTALQPLGGRLMSSAPHVDGLLLAGPEAMDVDTATHTLQPVKTRNAVGDWSFNRTAAGAETISVRTTIGEMIRLGELYNLGGFSAPGVATNYPAAPSKGVQITDFFVGYSVGVVALTSGTLRLGKTVYSKNVAGAVFVQTDIVAAQALTKLTATGALNQYAYFVFAVPTPVWHVDDLGLVEIEATFVMANTGVLQVAYMGCHCNFNRN
jgi:hypothetical protein